MYVYIHSYIECCLIIEPLREKERIMLLVVMLMSIYRWLDAPTQANAYYAPEYNQFGQL